MHVTRQNLGYLGTLRRQTLFGLWHLVKPPLLVSLHHTYPCFSYLFVLMIPKSSAVHVRCAHSQSTSVCVSAKRSGRGVLTRGVKTHVPVGPFTPLHLLQQGWHCRAASLYNAGFSRRCTRSYTRLFLVTRYTFQIDFI
jgi:hypothetical protein